MEMVTLYHPELNTTIRVPERSAYLRRRAGWVDADQFVVTPDQPEVSAGDYDGRDMLSLDPQRDSTEKLDSRDDPEEG